MTTREFAIQVHEVLTGFKRLIQIGRAEEVRLSIYHVLDSNSMEKEVKQVVNEVLRILKSEGLLW